jgi:hypothetical protein
MTAREYWIRAGIESGTRDSTAARELGAITARPGNVEIAGVMGERHVGHSNVDVDKREIETTLLN